MDLFRRIFSQTLNTNESANGKASDQDSLTTRPEANDQTESFTKTSIVADQGDLISDGATRPLPPETVISSSNEHILFGQATDVGMVRTNNQDAAFSFVSTNRSSQQRPDFGLFIVADGMGGHHDGEKASAITASRVAAYITSNVFAPMLADDNDIERMPVTEAMIASVQKANAEVISKVPDGGTTLTAVSVMGDLAYIVHVGDSRVYLITKDGLEQVTRDHSYVQRLIELDRITREEANVHPQKNVLYRALGQNETLEVDAMTRRLPPNSCLLICSDGLWNMVSEQELIELTMRHTNPQEACEKLVALANAHGGNDNITAILLRMPSH
jgi:PPM family protein phosphatase